MFNFFANILGYILNGIYLLFKNYGIAIIIFSILAKVAMLPLSIKQQKTLKKNEKIQKEMKILQIKHKGNQEKLNQEMMELYKRENLSPFGGCFSVLIQMILIFAMFFLVRSPITYMKKVDSEAINSQIATIKEEQGENSVSAQYPEMSIIKYLQKENKTDDNKYINMNFFGLDLSQVPNENFNDIKVFIIPVLYVISSVISVKLTSSITTKKKDDEEEKVEIKEKNENANPEEMTQAMNNYMVWMMPILSVSISLVAPLGLALYWLVNNVIMIIERLILNKMFSKEEKEDV